MNNKNFFVSDGIKYTIIYSNRKSVAVQIHSDSEIFIKAPYNADENFLKELVASNKKRIEKIQENSKRGNAFFNISDQEKEMLRKTAQEIIPEKVEYYSSLLKVKPTKITITNAKTRFGSCSNKNSISFSYYLMKFPDEAIDYVVVHELCHIIHHNHSKAFYAEVEKILPDYKIRRNMLKIY